MRAHDSLSPLGIVLAVLSQIPAVAAKLPGEPRYYLAAGLALVVLHIGLRFDDIARVIGRRQLRHGGNAAVFIVAVLAILGIVNWAANRYAVRWDLTKSGKYSLSDQTKKVVAGITEELRITHFFQSGERGESENLLTKDRLRQYGLLSSKIKVEDVDARKDPKRTRAEDIKVVPTLVLEYKGKREQINSGSEQDLTGAIIKITRDGKKTVCFLKGEGERETGDMERTGYSSAKAALEKAQYGTQDFTLGREAKVPEACTLLVVPGAQADLSVESVAALSAFVKKGGRALVFFEPDFKHVGFPNLISLVKEWNIEVGEDIVLEITAALGPMGLVRTADERIIVDPGAQYPYHEITRNLAFATYYDGARRVAARKETLPGVTAQNLVQTSEESWAETDLSLKGIRFDEGKDTRGPVGIAAAATLKAPEPTPAPAPAASPAPDAPKPTESRVAVFGDVDFASNGLIRQAPGNETLFLGTVAWLTGDQDLISIPPRNPDDHRIRLMPQTFQFWAVLLAMAFAMPVLFVVLGIVTWWRRR